MYVHCHPHPHPHPQKCVEILLRFLSMFYSFHFLPVFIYAGFAYQSHCFCLYLPPVFECLMFLCCNSFIPPCYQRQISPMGDKQNPLTLTSRGVAHPILLLCHRWWKGFPNIGKLFLLLFFSFFFRGNWPFERLFSTLQKNKRHALYNKGCQFKSVHTIWQVVTCAELREGGRSVVDEDLLL